MSKTKERLAELEIYYHKMMQEHPPHSDYFYYRDTFVSYARTLPWVMKKEFKRVNGFKEWFSRKHNYLTGFFHDLIAIRYLALNKSADGKLQRYKGKLIALVLFIDRISTDDIRELAKDYFAYLEEMTEEWTGIISGGRKVKTCSFCKAEFEKYEIINGELFCPECGWEKAFAEKQTASNTDSLNMESRQKPEKRQMPEPEKDRANRSHKILSDTTIKRQLIADAVQYPATLASLAIFGPSIVYLAVLSPVMGKALWAVIPLIISGTTAVISFIVRYTFLCNTEYPKKIKQMMEDKEQAQIFQEEAKTKKQRAELLAGFGNINYAEGLKAVTNLSEQFEQLQTTLVAQRETNPYTLPLFSGLIVDTFKQGLSVLSDALDMIKTIHSSDLRLKKEFADLEIEIADLSGKEKESERLRIKKETLASHKQRLDLLDRLQLRVEQLIYQAGLCEASLHRTRIELSALRAQGSEGGIKTLTETLQETIQDVKEAQEELRRLEK